ncbi:BTB-kelch protein [Melia azedarach]|uniref:BTB-kelch protein n=1 Tax=Melia azedarach TaxID=155640 RepID=A0ACC1Y6I4_MELAZ|nr:BTB-kelch protein [Melia azedarach]
MDSLGLGGETAKKSAMWLYPKVLGLNPPERWGHSACYSHGLVYVFGGCCGGFHFGDVLMLNLETMVWSNLATTGQGPGPRDSHSAVLVGRKMIVFGGTNGYKKVNDLHILDLDSKEWIRPECRGDPPSPRESHTATLVHDDKMVIFGGSGEGEANYLNDLHVLNLKTMRWASPTAKGDIPVPRDSHSANVIANRLFVYGGDCGDRYHGDIDMLDLRTLTWSKLAINGSSPGVRAGHAAVNIGTKICIIGGVGDKHYYNDIWILDVTTCLWSQLDTRGQQPQGRFSHTAVVADSDVVIYGGCGEDERPLNELLVLVLGAEHLNGCYNISMCKIFGNHWNQAKRRFPGGAEDNSKNMFSGNNEIPRKQAHEAELELKQTFPFASGILHPRKRRTLNLTNAWEIESEQEEHSLSLSQHSSPSQSDQEQTPVLKASDSVAGSQGLHLFKQMNQIPKCFQLNNGATNQRESWNMIQKTTQDHQFSREHQNHKKSEHILQVVYTGRQGTQHPAEPQSMEAWPIQNLIGAEVQGKIDGAFDSGFLMTATVNGKIFRGVLFPHGPGILSRVSPLTQLCPNSNHAQPFKLSQQPIVLSTPETAEKHRQTQANNRHLHIVRSASPSGKQPKQGSDLEGVVLTLGGPGTAGS